MVWCGVADDRCRGLALKDRPRCFANPGTCAASERPSGKQLVCLEGPNPKADDRPPPMGGGQHHHGQSPCLRTCPMIQANVAAEAAYLKEAPGASRYSRTLTAIKAHLERG